MSRLNLVFTAFLLVPNFIAYCGNIPPTPIPLITVHKCCPSYQFMLDHEGELRCHNITNQTEPWKPTFENGESVQPYKPIFGIPSCKATYPWRVDNISESCDKLVLMKDGKLRHTVYPEDTAESCDDEENEAHKENWDFAVNEYCVDKLEFSNADIAGEVAWICVPKREFPWHNADFLIRRIINPVFRILSVMCLLTVAVIYFILPQLCDLIGNIITTIAVCLICIEVANIVHIFIEFHSSISYLTVDSAIHISTLCAFFWLNSFGYYIWKTFRSRNVFLRITDGKKYCYYSIYVWGSTISMAGLALFSHFIFDTNTMRKVSKKVTESTVGEIGMYVFCTTIAVLILINVFFCLSTGQVIKRMSSYGRIHHKLKYNFSLFVKVFIIMTVNWIFYMLARIPYNATFYVYVFTNLLQAGGILYVTVIDSKKVRFLLRKACCHDKCISSCCRPGDHDEATDWGEEMMAMNLSSFHM